MNLLRRFVVIVAAGVAVYAQAELTNFEAVADALIVATSPNNNGGGSTFANCGLDKFSQTHRALFRFDLSSLPPGTVITSAVFTLNCWKVAPGFGGGDFDLHAVTGPWNEGAGTGGQGSAAQPGEVTWNDRMSGSAAWTNGGGDFLATPLASLNVSGTGSLSWDAPGLAAAAQSWVDDPSSNDGMILKEATESGVSMIVVDSSEGTVKPSLAIGYTVASPPPPPPAAGITQFTATGLVASNGIILAWSNSPAARYDVLYTRRLDPTQQWIMAEANIPAATNTGANLWTDPPYLASPAFAANSQLFFAVQSLAASPSGMPVQLQVVVSNLSSPVAMAWPPDGSDRLFICEQTGKVLVVDSSRNLLPAPFLNLGTNVRVLSGGYDERGLLGLAFHPGYATNRKFYVYYSAPKTGTGINHESILAEFLCTATNANIADPDSQRIVLRFDEPEANHNGGSLSFGPDGYLYISTGDGGGAGDVHGPFGNAQILTNLLGKMLRIDVNVPTNYAIPPDNPFATNGPPIRPEIFAYGFRNPWKAAFDGTNCWVADVGQNLWEEIDLLRPGRNYGWRIMEGHHAYDPNIATNLGVNIPSLEFPIHEYKHGRLGISIIGGHVYRGTNYPALQGSYVFGDFSTNFNNAAGALYYLQETRTNIWERFTFWLAPTGAPLGRYVKSLGTDQAGEIYLLSTTILGPTGLSGDLRKILPP